MRMLSHRVRFWLWMIAWQIAYWALRPWLYYERWENERIDTWYMRTFPGNVYRHEAYINGDWR